MGFLIAELLLYIETGKKMMKIERDSLVRYFLGQMSEEEKEALHQWLEADEANRKLFIRERIRFDASLLVDEEVVRAGKKKAAYAGLAGSLHGGGGQSVSIVGRLLCV